ncbi:hypothetical protein [Paractinoplanes hotanensis]|uniref:Uncharacterized protein n=1 Tax=Paractinoplanes hotanensis TaxID=2906497 RepID=A0ABT0Y007_9ACTN|nr:hypothetical protein [Actinoplanes hotanensis]MCM4079375.1 hypothetical protein [Actinoplanes hotanensis]
MSATCALVEFLRAGRPGQVPLRACCVAALLVGGRGGGRGCPPLPADDERVPVAEQAGAS